MGINRVGFGILIFASIALCLWSFLWFNDYYWMAVDQKYDPSARVPAVVSAAASLVTAITTLAYLWATLAVLMQTIESARQDRLDRIMPATITGLESADVTIVSSTNETLEVRVVEIIDGEPETFSVNEGVAKVTKTALAASVNAALVLNVVGSGAVALEIFFGDKKVGALGAVAEGTKHEIAVKFPILVDEIFADREDINIELKLVSKALLGPVREVTKYRLIVSDWEFSGNAIRRPKVFSGRLLEIERDRRYSKHRFSGDPE